MQQVTGKTAMMIMLADPVSHIRGTVMINATFEALGHDAFIVPVQVDPANLAQVVDATRRMGNVAGLGITIPHKIAVVPLMDELTVAARRAGAVNFIRRDPDGRLIGTNTDGAGFMAGLARNGVDVAGRSALLVGAGGVARPIAFALADAGVTRIDITNRSRPKAEELAAAVAAAVPGCQVRVVEADADAVAGVDLVVNATSLGMAEGDPLPVPADRLDPATVVAEVVVTPAVTALLAAAQTRGCRIVPGAEMLKPQPALVAEFFSLPKAATAHS